MHDMDLYIANYMQFSFPLLVCSLISYISYRIFHVV